MALGRDAELLSLGPSWRSSGSRLLSFKAHFHHFTASLDCWQLTLQVHFVCSL